MSNDIPSVDSIPFEDVCRMLEKLYNKRKNKVEHDKILKEFIDNIKLRISEIKDKKNANLFPLMRLLLPKLERERSYNLKETTLGQILVEVIPLSKQSQDAKKLLKWGSDYSSRDCDFAGEAYYVLKNKAKNSSNLLVGDINNMLDKIAVNNKDNKKQMFTNAMRNLNAEEFKWFLRIILKDLKCGVGDNRILAALHPRAPELFKSRESLWKVCEDCDDDTEHGIQVLHAVGPMLLTKLDVTNVSRLPNNKTYQIEEKFDGERFQMHMKNGVFAYFSRSGFPTSENYGKTYENGMITPLLKDCFKADVTSFILDGEMMGWHKEYRFFGSKGMAFDVKKLTDKAKFRPCFFAFDILYYNGVSLVGPPENGGMPLKKRLEILDMLFTDKLGIIQHSKRESVQQSSDILDALHKAMEKQEEGIVVKDTESYYIPGERKDGWYKIKPEYTEGAMTELDLVILGADKAINKRHGHARCFLVACLDATHSGDNERRWLCMGRVSTGLTYQDRERICAKLQMHWHRADDKPPPSHLVFNRSKPDFWIEPEKSVVLQIRASELTSSTVYGTSHTLRFPRVVHVRDDKPVDNVMTLNDFNQIIGNKGSVVKLNKDFINEENIDNDVIDKTTRKRPAKPRPQIPEQFKVPKLDNVEVTSNALFDRKICIISDDDDCSIKDLTRIVKSHGGHVVSGGSNIWCYIVGNMTIAANEAIKFQKNDITTTSWLRSLPASDDLCTLNPLDMLSIKKTTRLNFARYYDDFGDSYTTPTNEATLKRCFDKMDDDDIHLTTREMRDLDIELFGGASPYSFLRSCCIHFVECNDLIIILAKTYGASVYNDNVYNLTHVVVSNKANSELITEVKQKYKDVWTISEDWLEACFSQEKLVPEENFNL